jgi:uncharacterized protein
MNNLSHKNLSQIEKQLTGHIRNPDQVALPTGIEPRRAKIYSELFYNNIESFISSGFPVLRGLIEDNQWHVMIRDFMVNHQCHTPYFLEISQEFMLYLQQTRTPQADDLPFMLELAHYEWVELALDVHDTDLSDIEVEPEGDLVTSLPVVSPLAWSLAYQYPVHQIGPTYIPRKAPDQATYLVVHRNRQDMVEFMATNAVTARLLEMLQSDAFTNGGQVLAQMAQEMQHPQPQQVIDSGLDILKKLHSLDIILGTKK